MQFKRYRSLRLWSMFKKELTVIRRDYRTYVFVLVSPFLQAVLFGLIINNDAKHIPTVVVAKDSSQFTNSIIQAFKNTDYFAIKSITQDEKAAEQSMQRGDIKFIIHIPQNFTRDLVRNETPHILLEGDATDPVVVNNAFHASSVVATRALSDVAKGPLDYLASQEGSFVIDTHAKYNPAVQAQYHTLPGLLATILTISLALVMAISITGEYENGTMEMLLITPINPLEVILGKLLPNIFLGYILFFAILIVAHTMFKVPFYGSALLLSVAAFPFIIANLSFGIATSCIAKTQFQASQIAGTYTLPAVLFSGFLFPRDSMPHWAQWLSDLFPSTYFLKISSDVMLKGSGFWDILPDILPIVLFAVVLIFISYKFYRKTLD
jgi:ABC-2 type transport system permease protein